MVYLPDLYKNFERKFPNVAKSYRELSVKCHDAGPLDEKTRRLVKLGVAVGMCSEGAVRSHVRRALDAGATREEVAHAILLSLTTAGFPTLAAALKWMDEVPEAASAR